MTFPAHRNLKIEFFEGDDKKGIEMDEKNSSISISSYPLCCFVQSSTFNAVEYWATAQVSNKKKSENSSLSVRILSLQHLNSNQILLNDMQF